ncbi:MAG: tRNA-dihydrouridine synthase family protein [Clostridia bacterium]|nr:tRNA-dihydrouridine synthase family protein [Clostridia bacterium]
MDIRMAPMEGVTDAIYRRLHQQHFGCVRWYYIPFVSPTQHHVFTPRELRSIAPQYNQGVPVVPQLLGKDPVHFIWAAGEMQQMGYDEVNLNIGCPSGTVTAKGKGSGMLRDLDGLRSFLDEVCAHSPLPVSVKTRIGFDSPDEWPLILDALSSYPVKELIIHPRCRIAFYKPGTLRPETFDLARAYHLPLVYNGDLFTCDDCEALQARYPGIPMMLGRGLISNPALARELNGGAGITTGEIRSFHDALHDAYRSQYPLEQAHSRIRELMKYMACCFADAEKPLKAIRKSTPATYEAAVARLLDCPLRDQPGYAAQIWSS